MQLLLTPLSGSATTTKLFTGAVMVPINHNFFAEVSTLPGWTEVQLQAFGNAVLLFETSDNDGHSCIGIRIQPCRSTSNSIYRV